MQYGDPGLDWTEWLSGNEDASDEYKLATLREYIAASAHQWNHSGDVTVGWANKKLLSLGITDLIRTSRHYYAVSAMVTGRLTMTVTASDRADAVADATRRLGQTATDVPGRLDEAGLLDASEGFKVISGPDDVDVRVPDDAPQTVAATLEKFREIILLGNVSGPHWNCNAGCNTVLAEYGLAPIPPRKTFEMTRTVEAKMVTVVEAYDEESAQRVAGWRWEDGRKGFSVVDAAPTGELTAVARS
jgi:hypothetical protein